MTLDDLYTELIDARSQLADRAERVIPSSVVFERPDTAAIAAAWDIAHALGAER